MRININILGVGLETLNLIFIKRSHSLVSIVLLTPRHTQTYTLFLLLSDFKTGCAVASEVFYKCIQVEKRKGHTPVQEVTVCNSRVQGDSPSRGQGRGLRGEVGDAADPHSHGHRTS